MPKSYFMLVDAGNTLCKYSVYSSDNNNLLFNDFFDYSSELMLDKKLSQLCIDLVLICSVKKNSFIDQYKTICVANWQCKFVVFNPLEYQYIPSKYSTFKTLGADRWAAILGLSLQQQSNFCIIDCGTAITVDYVIDNIHLGGLIGPGLNSLKLCLNKSTDNIKNSLPNSIDSMINYTSTSTIDCISNASKIYFQSFIEHILQTNQLNYGVDFKTYLTGGNSNSFIPAKNYNIAVVDNLIMVGLLQIKRNYFY